MTMSRRYRFPARLLTAALVCALAACSSAGDPRLESANAIEIRVRNTGSVALRDISVLVAEDAAPINIGVLAAGETSGAFGRASLHENPLVSATADGRSLVSHPVEGFSPGFNHVLPPSRYTISLEDRVSEGQHLLVVRVSVSE